VKVLHVITRMNQGGTARWLEKLSNGLISAGWDSVIIAGEVGQNEVEDSCFEELHGIKVHSLGKGNGPISDLRAFFQLRAIFKNLKPDVVNTHTSKAGVIGRLAAASIFSPRPRIVHTYHGHLLYGYFSMPVTRAITFVEKWMASLTNQFIVAGKTVRDELILSGVGSINKYSIIKPGVDSEPKLDPEVIRSQFGISKNVIVVGWMGRFEHIKSPNRVLELAINFPSIIFLMAGDGSLFDDLKSKAPTNLLLPGWCVANEIWSASDIALLTSENEALPIALIEAGLTGLPIVAENVGAVSEVITHESSGFLCSSFEERAQAITLLAKDKQLRNSMGENARKFCLSEFSPLKFTNHHIEVYLGELSK
jgi:glycosyltransferase involved in cell wall biosynthesis